MPSKEKRVRSLTNVDRVGNLLGFTKQEALEFCLKVGDDTGATFYMVYEALVKALRLTSKVDIISEYLIKRINDERMELLAKDGWKFSNTPSASFSEAPGNKEYRRSLVRAIADEPIRLQFKGISRESRRGNL